MRSLAQKRAPDLLRLPRVIRPLSYTVLTVLFILCVTAKSPSSAEETNPSAAPLTAPATVRIFQLAANDVVYDPVGQMLYTSIPSSFGQTGNSILPINPTTLVPGSPIWMGSEPGRMAISGDGKYLYAALNGAGAIRRLDLLSKSPDQRFALGNKLSSGTQLPTIDGPYYARDLDVLRGRNDSVLAIRYFPCCSGSFGVAAYRDGNKLPVNSDTIDLWSTFSVTTTDDPSVVYGVGLSSEFLKFTVNDNGISLVRVTSSFDLINGGSGSDLAYAAGRVYTTNGLVIDPETPKIIGKLAFPGPTTVAGFVPDPATGRVYVLAATNSCGPNCTYTAQIYAFDINTFSLVDSIDVPGMTGFPRSFIRWGANGFAFRNNQFNNFASPTDQVVVIRTSLVPSAESIDLPTPTQPQKVPAPTLSATIKEIALPNDDLIYDATRRLIYASVPGFAGALGNSIVPVEPNSGNLGSHTPIGTNPGKLAISRDDHYLYTALITDVIADEKIRRLNLQSQNVDAEFGLRITSSDPTRPPDSAPQFVTDMDVMPNDPTAVAFATAHSLGGFQPMGTALYKNGSVLTPRFNAGVFTVETSDDPLVFYGTDTQSLGGNGATLVQWQIGLPGFFNDPYSPAYIASGFVGGFACDVRWSGGQLFDCQGRVANPTSLLPVGTFDLNGSLGRNVPLPDTAAHKAYFLSGITTTSGSTWTIRVYDTDTFLPLGVINVPNVKGPAGSLLRWGSNGLAFGTGGNQIFLIQSSLINSPILPTPFINNVAGDGIVSGSTSFTATLSSGGTPLSGKTVTFTVNGAPVCGVAPACPTTNAFGIATLSNVNLPGINAGTFAGAVRASFAGDANFASANNTGTLAIAPVPQLFTDASHHLIAVDSVTFVRDPLSVVGSHNFSLDGRTRVMIFTSNLGLTQPSSDLSVTVAGVPFTVEAVGPLPGVPDVSYIIVKLEPALNGNVQVSITFRGVTSNAGLISIGP